MRYRHACAGVALMLLACSDRGADERHAEPQGWVDTPTAELPDTLSELGVHGAPPEPQMLHPRGLSYEPAWPLWSNGSRKWRAVVLPRGERIRTDGESWRFPVGTVFTKTFEFDGLGPAETRVLWQRAEGEWEYAGYLWREDGTDADRLELRRGVSVPATGPGGEPFEHRVPNRLDCRTCHESSPAGPVLGFTAWQLAAEQLRAAADLHVFEGTTPAAEQVTGPDAASTDIMGYVMGNCSHCHNGAGLPDTSSAYDLRYRDFLANTIGVHTDNSVSLPGVRVTPGDPTNSVLYRAFAGDFDDADGAAGMPPLGVELRDQAAAAMLRDWILNLEEQP